MEEGGTDTEEGGAFFDGLDVILAHAHGEMFEFGADDPDTAQFFEDFAEAGEAEAGDLRVLGEGRHGHHADQLQIGQGLDLISHGGDGADGQAEFLFFLAGVDFQEDFDFLVESEFGGHGIDFLGQAERVHGVDEGDDGEQLFHFVALKVADHVPARPGQERGIVGGSQGGAALDGFFDDGVAMEEVLDFGFAEVGEVKLEDVADDVGFDGFGDGDEPDILRASAGAGAGAGDVILNPLQIVSDFLFHVLQYCKSTTGIPAID